MADRFDDIVHAFETVQRLGAELSSSLPYPDTEKRGIYDTRLTCLMAHLHRQPSSSSSSSTWWYPEHPQSVDEQPIYSSIENIVLAPDVHQELLSAADVFERERLVATLPLVENDQVTQKELFDYWLSGATNLDLAQSGLQQHTMPKLQPRSLHTWSLASTVFMDECMARMLTPCTFWPTMQPFLEHFDGMLVWPPTLAYMQTVRKRRTMQRVQLGSDYPTWLDYKMDDETGRMDRRSTLNDYCQMMELAMHVCLNHNTMNEP